MDLASRNVGTAVLGLTTALLNELEIMLPSMEVQEKIVSVLAAMDAKIIVNKKINDNLQQQASVLFFDKICVKKLPNPLHKILFCVIT